MLAEAEHFNVLDDHHLVVGDGIERPGQNLVDVLPVAARQEPQRPRHARRGLQQPLALGVFAQLMQDATNSFLDPGKGRGFLVTRSFREPVWLHGSCPFLRPACSKPAAGP